MDKTLADLVPDPPEEEVDAASVDETSADEPVEAVEAAETDAAETTEDA